MHWAVFYVMLDETELLCIVNVYHTLIIPASSVIQLSPQRVNGPFPEVGAIPGRPADELGRRDKRRSKVVPAESDNQPKCASEKPTPHAADASPIRISTYRTAIVPLHCECISWRRSVEKSEKRRKRKKLQTRKI
ncbi:Uncharacterized protein BM_BM17855 [Brugia malayi]|uniref:Uncharacterized protein n=1 Tax=Brugia malayi TaxID=6279 RepID=A0A4E9FR09_BRUMA|nr:Uncharacterized protein BM_BM17855 [Brugia malayi]VIO99584.1 Uncharacterized protein BM_BM17855 [Brugia malayi]